MTSDHYTILGVTPAAETVVIGAAYRALMRHYHPDTNPDPAAQAKAREITAAYNVLRDPAKRAAYDQARADDDALWETEEPPRRPPPMRAVGIAASLLAIGLVAAVWKYAPPVAVPVIHPGAAAPADQPEPEIAAPIAPLRPESERLADINRAAPTPPTLPAIDAPDPVAHNPNPPEANIVPALRRAPVRMAVTPPALRSVRAPPVVRMTARPAPPPTAQPRAPVAPKSDRVATLDRMSSGFFTQSMTYADGARKRLLVAVRTKGDSDRKACRSDACVADTYVRQIRATSAIMAGKPGAPK